MVRLLVQSYLLGSIPFAYLAGRLFGKLDIRNVGSRNVGTTNVFKNVGALAGLVTALGDAGKGLYVVYLANMAPVPGAEFIALLAAMIGHNWPVWLGFHGGGGLATLIGGLLALSEWWVVLVLLALWGIMYLVFRDHCESALAACAIAPGVLGSIHRSWAHFSFGLGAAIIIGAKQAKAILEKRPMGTPPRAV